MKPRSSGAAARDLQHAVEDRQQERGGLAGAGVGAADQVVAVHDDRDDRALDRRGRREAADADAFDQRRLEAERVEADRARIVLGLRPGDWRAACAGGAPACRARAGAPGATAPASSPARRLMLCCMGVQI